MKSGLAYINISDMNEKEINKDIINTLIKEYKYKDRCNDNEYSDTESDYLVIKDGNIFKDSDPKRFDGIVECKSINNFLNEAVLIVVPVDLPGIIEKEIYRDDATHFLTVNDIKGDEWYMYDKQYYAVDHAVDAITKIGKTVISITWVDLRQQFVIFYK